MKPVLNAIIVFTLLSFSGASYPDSENFSQLWMTEGFKNPESVIYDPKSNVIYVSNVNGPPAEKDGNGFISRVSLDGNIINLEWVTGLHAPKGLAIAADHLYVADVDSLVEIDIAGGKISNRYLIDGAKFLNDAVAAEDGTVYVSDTFTNTIYRLKDGKIEPWLSSPELVSPNGLCLEKQRMLVGSAGIFGENPVPGEFLAISLADKTISSASGGKPIGALDGVEADLDGDFYVSDWAGGKIYHVERNGEFKELMTLEQGTADIDYIQAKDILLVPLMISGKLVAYKAHDYDQ